MCFSAEASFVSSALLTIVGTLSLMIPPKKNQLILALTPLIFAFQQFNEGLLWLTTNNLENFLQYGPLLRNIFLFIAVFVWPLWIPLSFFAAEGSKVNRSLLGFLVAMALVYDFTVVYGMLFWWSFDAVSMEIFEHSIQYHLPVTQDYNYYAIPYYILTLTPPFLSRLKGAFFFAICNLAMFYIALYFFSIAFVSVWCFFAAWVSLSVYCLIRWNKAPTLSSTV